MTVDGLISVASVLGFAETVTRLEVALSERRIVPALRLDHSAAASGAGLQLRPVLLYIFGDPRIGTAIMEECPTAGLDLPLKLLVWEGEKGRVRIGYNDPDWIATRHGVTGELAALSKMKVLLGDLTSAAAGASG